MFLNEPPTHAWRPAGQGRASGPGETSEAARPADPLRRRPLMRDRLPFPSLLSSQRSPCPPRHWIALTGRSEPVRRPCICRRLRCRRPMLLDRPIPERSPGHSKTRCPIQGCRRRFVRRLRGIVLRGFVPARDSQDRAFRVRRSAGNRRNTKGRPDKDTRPKPFGLSGAVHPARKKPCPPLPPTRCAPRQAFAFRPLPRERVSRHLSVSAMLLFGNPVAEMRQRLALEALLSRERKALARGVFKASGSSPAAESHRSLPVLQERPVVEPQVTHLRHVPLHAVVKLPHSAQESPV